MNFIWSKKFVYLSYKIYNIMIQVIQKIHLTTLNIACFIADCYIHNYTTEVDGIV